MTGRAGARPSAASGMPLARPGRERQGAGKKAGAALRTQRKSTTWAREPERGPANGEPGRPVRRTARSQAWALGLAVAAALPAALAACATPRTQPARATLPVFALGGAGPLDAATARAHGAHGVAMLRAAWAA